MGAEDFKRKLAAIFSADVAGYSRLMGEDEAATVRILATYREVMTALIKQHRGRVVDSPGDNLLAEFASVVDAVQCAVAVQKELQVRNAELPENRRMEFRIGINLGDVIEEEGRIYGDGVNIAARLEALAHPGGICVSKTAFDHIESKLPLGYEYLGEQSVKNIQKPVGAYRVLMEPRVTVAERIEKEKAVPLWRRKVILTGGAALVLVIIAALIWDFYSSRPSVKPASVDRMAYPLPDKPSIAVLPFVNMSGDPEQEYFSDGITEEIITALSKIERLFVIARNSTFTYKGKSVDVQKVGKELGVRYILEGSVRKSGDKVRITAQLVDAITGKHLWAERYDRGLKDIFAVQDEITKKIITALQVKLTEGEQARLYGQATDDLEAYLKMLQAREHFSRMNKQGSMRARELAKEAIELDPEYAGPYVILALTHMMDLWFKFTESPQESMKLAVGAAEKALALDDSDPGTFFGLCMLYIMQRRHDKAIAAAERAVALSPSGATAHSSLGTALSYAGRQEEAIVFFKKAISLNPFPPSTYFRNLGSAYRMAGQYEKAVKEYKKALQQTPDDLFTHLGLAVAYISLGREEEARTEAAEVFRIHPGFSLEHFAKTLPYKNQSDIDCVISSLRKAGLK
jgi:adenylate cyclase